MFEAINPLFWWGTTALAAPIIIHLINRLRYKRVRWAAMEFLLKSQQRNRRKLILEQLLLLLTRCVLVMLVVLLVVRPLWMLGEDRARAAELPSYHVVLVDDTLSMQDREDPQGKETQTAFREAVRLVAELAQKAADSSGAHYVTVLRFSNLKNPDLGRPVAQLGSEPPGQQVSDREARELRNKLETLDCSYLRVHPRDAVKEAQGYLASVKDGNKYLHLFSDFRRRDWTEADAEELCQGLGELAHARGGNVQVRFNDVAQPRRSDHRQEVPRSHFNIGITSLKADARVITPGVRVRLTAAIRNFSDVEKTGLRLAVRMDGVEKNEFARIVERISGGEQKEDVAIDLVFSNEEKLGLKQISVAIDDKDHLPADNVRFTFVELRKEIPVLLVDPEPKAAASDSDYVNWAFNEKTNLHSERIRPSDLKNRKDLDQFSVIFVLNVPGIGSLPTDLDAEGLKALEGYLFRGGSVVFFLGPRVNVASYNEHLYKNGQGVFPVPLTLRPEPGKRDAFVDEPPDLEDFAPKLRFLRGDHPVFRIYKDRSDFLYFMAVNRYFKVDPTWRPTESVTVVAQLANRRPVENYRLTALDIVKELNQDKLREHARRIQEAVSDAASKRARKGPLIDALGGLLDDPALAAFWKEPARQKLRQHIADFHETLVTGDPLILEAAVGKGRTKGRVMAILTSAGPTPISGRDYEWNNWATLMDPNQFVPYVLMLGELHRYMGAFARSAKEMEVNHLLGADVELRLDKDRYDRQVQLWFQKEGADAPAKVADITGQEQGGDLSARIAAPRGPGFYLLKLNQPPADNSYTPKGEPEERPLAFNVDNRAEGILSRIAESELDDQLATGMQKGTLKLSSQESQAFAQSRPLRFVTAPFGTTAAERDQTKSWSDYAAILLLFVGLLLFEQWLAVRLSYHLKGSETRAAVAPVRAATV